MFNKNYYDTKKQNIQEKFQKTQQKWIQMCELGGKEYIDFQTRVQELNEELTTLTKEEETSKIEETKNK